MTEQTTRSESRAGPGASTDDREGPVQRAVESAEAEIEELERHFPEGVSPKPRHIKWITRSVVALIALIALIVVVVLQVIQGWVAVAAAVGLVFLYLGLGWLPEWLANISRRERQAKIEKIVENRRSEEKS